MPSPELKLEFSRFEFKYVLQKSLRKAVEAELEYFMELDPFVSQTAHNKYFVRSLYFDDPRHTAFYDKIDGLKSRAKFRIRTYTNNQDGQTPQFLEEKGRHDNKVFKHRILIEDSIQTIIESNDSSNDLLTKFRYQWFKKTIRPVALIDYLRRPYISKFDHEFRVTFDERLQARDTSTLFPCKSTNAALLLPGYTVMEVKFGHRVPAWFHRIIQSFELRRVSISKICEGMKSLHLAEDL
ncbi:MAG: polyphosphate polymerase domain-containing protein [Pseudomonadales bacterium]